MCIAHFWLVDKMAAIFTDCKRAFINHRRQTIYAHTPATLGERHESAGALKKALSSPALCDAREVVASLRVLK